MFSLPTQCIQMYTELATIKYLEISHEHIDFPLLVSNNHTGNNK